MSRSAFLAVAAALTCAVILPHPASAQRSSRPAANPPAKKTSGAPARAPARAPEADTARGPMIYPGTGSIVGAVLDSLHDGMLPDASVIVRELPSRHTVTTSAGAFRIDSVPPGRYTLELMHPVLDSVGIRVVSDTIPVTAGAVQTVELAIPGEATLTSSICSAAKLRFGPGVIAGHVLDADTEQPATGAEVSVAWTETMVGTDIGIRSLPRVRKATVEKDGTYRICGVPATFTGSLQAMRGGAKTAEVPIEVTRPLTMRLLYLPSQTAAARGDTVRTVAGVLRHTARPQTGNAVIRGKVTNAGGVPVADARVSVQGANATTSTGPDGSFTLTGVPAGTQAVLVRRVGYSPVEMPLEITTRHTNEMTVRLGAYTPQLSTVEVKAKADALSSTGFERRQKMGMGKYVTLDEIEKMRPTFTSDVLRRIPGLYVTGSGPSANVTTTRGNGCVSYMIDRNPVAADAGQSIDEIVQSHDVAAIEYYTVSEMPMELSSPNSNGCSLLVIWTKGQLKDPRTKK